MNALRLRRTPSSSLPRFFFNLMFEPIQPAGPSALHRASVPRSASCSVISKPNSTHVPGEPRRQHAVRRRTGCSSSPAWGANHVGRKHAEERAVEEERAVAGLLRAGGVPSCPTSVPSLETLAAPPRPPSLPRTCAPARGCHAWNAGTWILALYGGAPLRS